VCFAYRLSGVADPIFCLGQRRFSGASRFVIVERRRDNVQFFLPQCAMVCGLPNNWKRVAPVSLTREQTITQFVIDCMFAKAAFFKPRGDLLFRLTAR